MCKEQNSLRSPFYQRNVNIHVFSVEWKFVDFLCFPHHLSIPLYPVKVITWFLILLPEWHVHSHTLCLKNLFQGNKTFLQLFTHWANHHRRQQLKEPVHFHIIHNGKSQTLLCGTVGVVLFNQYGSGINILSKLPVGLVFGGCGSPFQCTTHQAAGTFETGTDTNRSLRRLFRFRYDWIPCIPSHGIGRESKCLPDRTVNLHTLFNSWHLNTPVSNGITLHLRLEKNLNYPTGKKGYR